MKYRALVLALPALGLLSGCATMEEWFGTSSPPPQPVVTAPPPPAPEPVPGSLAPASVNGRYTGALRLARGAARSCRPASIPATATVTAGRATLRLGTQGTMEGAAGQDGSITLAGNGISGEGSFRNNTLTGTATRGECRYTISLRKRR